MAWGMIVLGITRVVYNHGLRDVIEGLVNDPGEKWDELMLELLDTLLGPK